MSVAALTFHPSTGEPHGGHLLVCLRQARAATPWPINWRATTLNPRAQGVLMTVNTSGAAIGASRGGRFVLAVPCHRKDSGNKRDASSLTPLSTLASEFLASGDNVGKFMSSLRSPPAIDKHGLFNIFAYDGVDLMYWTNTTCNKRVLPAVALRDGEWTCETSQNMYDEPSAAAKSLLAHLAGTGSIDAGSVGDQDLIANLSTDKLSCPPMNPSTTIVQTTMFRIKGGDARLTQRCAAADTGELLEVGQSNSEWLVADAISVPRKRQLSRRQLTVDTEPRRTSSSAMPRDTVPIDLNNLKPAPLSQSKLRPLRRANTGRDPALPRSYVSAFNFFAKVARPALRKNQPELDTASFNREITKLWKSLTPEKRFPFDQQAAEDKKRYMHEMETYVPSPGHKKQKPRIKMIREARDLFEQRVSKNTSGPRPPKRPKSAYLLWVADTREEIKKANPTAKFCDVGRLLGERWRNLPAAEKVVYEARSDQDKQRYEVSKARFLKRTMMQAKGPAKPRRDGGGFGPPPKSGNGDVRRRLDLGSISANHPQSACCEHSRSSKAEDSTSPTSVAAITMMETTKTTTKTTTIMDIAPPTKKAKQALMIMAAAAPRPHAHSWMTMLGGGLDLPG